KTATASRPSRAPTGDVFAERPVGFKLLFAEHLIRCALVRKHRMGRLVGKDVIVLVAAEGGLYVDQHSGLPLLTAPRRRVIDHPDSHMWTGGGLELAKNVLRADPGTCIDGPHAPLGYALEERLPVHRLGARQRWGARIPRREHSRRSPCL